MAHLSYCLVKKIIIFKKIVFLYLMFLANDNFQLDIYGTPSKSFGHQRFNPLAFYVIVPFGDETISLE